MKKELIKKQTDHAFGKDVYLLGKDYEGIKYWLEAPKWDCDWYWGFGYVETYQHNLAPSKARDIDSHTHISGFLGEQEEYDFDKRASVKGEYVHNLIDNKTFASTTFTEAESWELSELFNQFYTLQKMAEFYHRGKCNTASTSIQSWKDKEQEDNINQNMIPVVTARIIEILTPDAK